MKKNFNGLFRRATLLLTAFLVFSCSLDLEVKDPNTIPPPAVDGSPTPGTLDQVYRRLNDLVGQANWFAMCTHPTDELMGPTRGTDWDDFGTWRKLHLHTWDGAHNQVNDTWNNLQNSLFQTTLLAETASGQTAAEAKFLRAFFSYIVVDLYGQLQYRPATAKILELPKVYTRAQAIDYIIAELEAALPNLPTFTGGSTEYLATKAAAQFLLAKCYLNRAVFKADPNKPAGPYTFDAADMNKVISNVDAAAAQGGLAIDDNYWDNFVWTNGTVSSENIFSRKNSDGINVVWYTCMGGHYNMTPSGWNGFTTLSDFYNSFEASDVRRSAPIPDFSTQLGRNAGFLIGQQRGPSNGKVGGPIADLKDRAGNPLVFTSDASLFFSSESKGIRTNKYPLDPSTINDGGWGSANDFVFFRFADLKLMKAEAILRGGAATGGETPVSIVNSIRSKRGVANAGTVDLTYLLAERGRELYLEGWRRNDMIRFGVFNNPVIERASTSDGSRVVFPIPNIALSSNPNLKQNFGY